MSNVVTQPHLPSLYYSYVAYMYIIPSPGLGERYRISLSEIVKAHSRSPSLPLASTNSAQSGRRSRHPVVNSFQHWSPQAILYACHETPSRVVGATSAHHSLRRMSSLGLGSIERWLARSSPHTHTFSFSPFTPSRILASWDAALVLFILPNLSLDSRGDLSSSIQYRTRIPHAEAIHTQR